MRVSRTEQKQFAQGKEIQGFDILRDSFNTFISCHSNLLLPLPQGQLLPECWTDPTHRSRTPLPLPQKQHCLCVISSKRTPSSLRSGPGQEWCTIKMSFGPRIVSPQAGRDAVRWWGKRSRAMASFMCKMGSRRESGWLPGFHGRGLDGVSDAPCSRGERAQWQCNGTSLSANPSISADLPCLLAEVAHFINGRGLALYETGNYFFFLHTVPAFSLIIEPAEISWFRRKSSVADQMWYWVKTLHLTKVLFKLVTTPMGVSREQSPRL